MYRVLYYLSLPSHLGLAFFAKKSAKANTTNELLLKTVYKESVFSNTRLFVCYSTE